MDVSETKRFTFKFTVDDRTYSFTVDVAPTETSQAAALKLRQDLETVVGQLPIA